MSGSGSLDALRAASPRAQADFPHAVEAAGEAVRQAILTTTASRRPSRPRRRLLGVSTVGAALATVAVGVAFLAVGSLDSAPGVEDATAAVRQAARASASAAELSGTAVVRITHDGQPWAGTTIQWHGDDLVVARGDERELRVVDGTLYGVDPERPGGWLELGDPKSIDPDSGTTPDEYLAAVREDVGGATLRRITAAMTGLTTHTREDGSTVYRGTVAAGAIARETGFKEGKAIRVLPFGYVAHGEAADARAQLDVALAVDAGGVVGEIAVGWGSWAYTVAYDRLGSTPAPAAPANARSLRELRAVGE
jgi:hypothetical protein